MNAGPPTGNGHLQYLNIVASEMGLAEMNGSRRIIFIPKEQVQKVEIRYGSQAERPLVQGISGLIFIGLGIIGLHMIIAGGLSRICQRRFTIWVQFSRLLNDKDFF